MEVAHNFNCMAASRVSVFLGVFHMAAARAVLLLLCLGLFFLSTDAAWCQVNRAVFGASLRGGNWRPLLSLKLTRASGNGLCSQACCEKPGCDAAWTLRGRCVLLACLNPGQCEPERTWHQYSLVEMVSRSMYRKEAFHNFRTGEKKMKRMKRSASSSRPSAAKSPKEAVPSPKPTRVVLSSSPVALGVSDNSTQPLPPGRSKEDLPNPLDHNSTASDSAAAGPFSNTSTTTGEPNEASSPTTTPAGATTQPVPRQLVVSAGENIEVTLPKNEVELNAYALPEPTEGMTYTFDWRLITHPKDYSGVMEGKHGKALKLSKLTEGLYEFKVIAEGDGASGEGFVNVTVNPEPRVNQPPKAVVSPKFQEISLPTSSTVIDGSQSTDDDKIVSYHWEEVKGPLREEKVSAETPILELVKLVPGNYTFSLTVVDSDGASDSALASLTVNKAVDYPPVANAGPNQVITLPQNSITLYGNQSTDDHGLVAYEWSLSPQSKGKVMEMQGVRTSTLQLSAMQEGDYTFQLTVTDSAGQQSTAEVTVIVQPENNKPPLANAGPEKELTLPVDSTTLDGSKSHDDQKIVSYHWEQTRGPEGAKIENAESAVATVTGLQVGTYTFTLTVRDERNLQGTDSVSIIVKEELNQPPVAKISGSIVVTLPVNTAVLDGSKSTDDKGIVSYLWTRDEASPAAGKVLNNSDHQAVLFLTDLVEGTYRFKLQVTDAKREISTDQATIEVHPDPHHTDLVEMILDVTVGQMTERQKGMLIRQIGVLLGVLDSDITVQKIQAFTEQSTQIVFFVRNGPGHPPLKGSEVALMLRSKLWKQKADFFIFRARQVDTVACQRNCSEHGHCDSFTKHCVCDPFWMENLLRVQLGDGESNCDWSVLYVSIAFFLIVVTAGVLAWGAVCCCRRRKGKSKRKSKYKILNGTDDQESMQLKPASKGGGRLKSPTQMHTSLMHSDSELDSDETIFTWPDREKGKVLRNENGSVRNGQGPLKGIKQTREELL
ncbi:dyslexia-associated protein KIAA0319-like protein [Polypterus senegalus]|uniref:dyslexia-associated protein KIAA0319-like protein n=1 Tax=Polypterus senegalus TaxID=55291 RepID=UPI001964E6C7|nr:dyslexia-associated protein KIAA0319-like protein [Polypterus senegalus]XP_039596748.1 dyslexia-associated protein KIAA0319-like protein [Polypterus senegalus]XP_039596749.1 dyslexia-associated protein KIAA0319-like protein [Polypterus senegalus]